jgi:hypothetical protein
VRLVDYAYNRKPGEEILAGQIYATYGCTDPLALNYNPVAVDDDGTCEYPLDCGEDNAIQLLMFDGYGDGWNGNTLTLSAPDGTPVESFTLNSGSEGATEFCLASGCYQFSAGGGNYLYEISWEMYHDSVLVASGTAGVSGLFSVNGDCSALYGCTDPDALNFNPDATFDDGTCVLPILGCTDPGALNFDPTAEQDDGSCYYDTDVLGCTDPGATNYDPSATYDDGTCTYPGLQLVDVAAEWCLGETMLISWTGGNAADLINLRLIHVTGNYVYASLGLVPNTGQHEWVIEGIDTTPGITYRLYAEVHPYPPSTYTYGNTFTVQADCAPACPADLDGDGAIATGDVLIMLGQFGCSTGCAGDLTADGAVTVEDFLILLGEFGNACL